MLPSARYSPGPFLAMAWLTTFVETASLTILATGADPSRKRSQIGGRDGRQTLKVTAVDGRDPTWTETSESAEVRG
jgi:hypothetical protein